MPNRFVTLFVFSPNTDFQKSQSLFPRRTERDGFSQNKNQFSKPLNEHKNSKEMNIHYKYHLPQSNEVTSIILQTQ